jgi:methylthioribose-1-phosphate isomerase
MVGRTAGGGLEEVLIAAPGSAAANYAFDVTPARLITGFITERGRCAPGRLEALFGAAPARAAGASA